MRSEAVRTARLDKSPRYARTKSTLAQAISKIKWLEYAKQKYYWSAAIYI
jgi:hypothetical protein